MPEILLKARNIEHVYEEGLIKTPVLKGVDLDIEASKLTAIVGKSGSGKSTLMHILGTLDTPTKGEIFFNGKNVLALKANAKATFRNRYLGFVYQFHHLLGDFSALENVMMPLLIDKVEYRLAVDRATYLLERIGLKEHINSLPSEMSGGERQRVAIVRALVHSPELILADEPTGNLDETNAATVFNLFKELVQDEGAAVVMVTHDSVLAAQCDHIYEITDGIVKKHVMTTEISLAHSNHLAQGQGNYSIKTQVSSIENSKVHQQPVELDEQNKNIREDSKLKEQAIARADNTLSKGDLNNDNDEQEVTFTSGSDNNSKDNLLADTEALMLQQRIRHYNNNRHPYRSDTVASRYLEPTPEFTPQVSTHESKANSKKRK